LPGSIRVSRRLGDVFVAELSMSGSSRTSIVKALRRRSRRGSRRIDVVLPRRLVRADEAQVRRLLVVGDLVDLRRSISGVSDATVPHAERAAVLGFHAIAPPLPCVSSVASSSLARVSSAIDAGSCRTCDR